METWRDVESDRVEESKHSMEKEGGGGGNWRGQVHWKKITATCWWFQLMEEDNKTIMDKHNAADSFRNVSSKCFLSTEVLLSFVLILREIFGQTAALKCLFNIQVFSQLISWRLYYPRSLHSKTFHTPFWLSDLNDSVIWSLNSLCGNIRIYFLTKTWQKQSIAMVFWGQEL